MCQFACILAAVHPQPPILEISSPGLSVPLGGGHAAKTLTQVPLLHVPAFAARAGRVCVLLGVNGSGKTTLLRTLAGLVAPQQGRAQFSGEPVHEASPTKRAKHIAYIAQRPEVSEAFCVHDVVKLGLHHSPKSEADAAVSEALSRVGASEFAMRSYESLSGGERQRIALARAMVQLGASSKVNELQGVLLADEPTSAMDPGHQLRALALLRELAASGLSVVVAMHDVGLALRHADDVALFARSGQGEARVVFAGEAAKLDRSMLNDAFGVRFQDACVGETTYAASVVEASSGIHLMR
jgi:iron complex transport system ATP-binding protein